MVDEGVRRAYLDPENKLRASLQADPAGARKNTKDNTPAVFFVELVKGDTVEITVAAKGGGSEAKSKFAMLNPSDSVVEWVLKTVPTMGVSWCPPGMWAGHRWHRGEGHASRQEGLMDPIDIQGLVARGPQTTAEKLRVKLYDKVDRSRRRRAGSRRPHHRSRRKGHRVHRPTRQSTRCADSQLRRHRPCAFRARRRRPYFRSPSLEVWPKFTYDVSGARRVNLDTVTRDGPPPGSPAKCCC